MFPQDPCIIYMEKECKVQVSVHRLQACHSYLTVLGGLGGESPEIVSQKSSPGSGIKHFQGLGLVVLNLDRVTKKNPHK